ncbi:hypothetical protein BDV59DRAFT_147353 [Aspergillus ambiguus]|uniref:uncharacterized protein n=1 Tax=Aspergillus ambiguus TaxID=176160 RepID=UPI003CCE1F1B
MGNSNSVAHTEIPSKLKELADVVQSAGEIDAARILRQIAVSKKSIESWRTKLMENDDSCNSTKTGVEEWFQCWKNNKNNNLSAEQVSRLSGLTKNWRRRTRADIRPCLYDWIVDPISKFWGHRQLSPNSGLIVCCLNDIDEAEASSTLNAIRRRVILVILHDIVQKERDRLQSEITKRKANTRGHPSYRDGGKVKLITKAISNIIDESYRPYNLSQDVRNRKRRRCTQLQRYGGRWSLFNRREAILEFPMPYAANNFERVKLEDIEIEALNAYEETMYDQDYRSTLQMAYEAIYDSYMSHRCEFPPWHNPPDNATFTESAPGHASQKRRHDSNSNAEGSARKRPSIVSSSHGYNAQGLVHRHQNIIINPAFPVQADDLATGINNGRMAPGSIPTDNNRFQPNTSLQSDKATRDAVYSHRLAGHSQFGPRPMNTAQPVDVNTDARGSGPPAQPNNISTPGNISTRVTADREKSAAFSHSLVNIPQPEAADAWAALEGMAYSGGFSHHLPADVPQPEAADASAANDVMAQNSSSLAPPPASDIRRCSTTDLSARANMSLLPQQCGIANGVQDRGATSVSCRSKDFNVRKQESLHRRNDTPVIV